MFRPIFLACVTSVVAGCDWAPIANAPKGPAQQDTERLAELESQMERLAALESQIETLAEQVRALSESASDTEDSRVIRAEGFVVQDSDGKVRARLGFDRLGKEDQVPGLFVYDKNGTKRLFAVNTSLGAGIALCDYKGKAIVEFTDRKRGLNDLPFGHPSGLTGQVLWPKNPAPD